ncbi:MAG: hypothetical protein KDD40_08990, partial [Bdellovibrionales bacterium]|nr:hypothetical protein [Bdellovibrionales bacterium]
MRLKKSIGFFSLLCALSFLQPALAGIEHGNTGIISNITFELGEHPEEDRFWQLFENAKNDIPVELRNAIINDFGQTSALKTSENVLWKDLKNQVVWEEVERHVTIEEDASGKKTTTKLKYLPVEKLSELGFHVEFPPKYKMKDKDNAPVAALTYTKRNQVIYFSEAIKSLSSDEILELVLHEQAHRLESVFGERAKDERFAPAWAHEFLKFLKNPAKNKEKFYKTLKRNDISTYVQKTYDPQKMCGKNSCLPQEEYLGGNEYKSTFAVRVRYDDIVT